jgi:hypothetical protein
MVTPTFFAGACVVVAALLAYGTTQTHLVFRGIGPACEAANCVPVSPGAGPGVQLGTSATREAPGHEVTGTRGAPARARTAGAGPHAGRAGRQDTRREPREAPATIPSRVYAADVRVIIAYQTVRSWRGGFVGAMTITNPSRSAVPNWLLWLHFVRTRLDHVWGARWYPVGPRAPGAGVVAAPVSQPALPAGASTRFMFRASGHAGPPDGCFFDTSRCRFTRLR